MTDATPSWQDDPTGRHDHRYWDGSAWTDHVADAGVASTDPYEATAAPTPAEPTPSESAAPDEPVAEPSESVAEPAAGTPTEGTESPDPSESPEATEPTPVSAPAPTPDVTPDATPDATVEAPEPVTAEPEPAPTTPSWSTPTPTPARTSSWSSPTEEPATTEPATTELPTETIPDATADAPTEAVPTVVTPTTSWTPTPTPAGPAEAETADAGDDPTVASPAVEAAIPPGVYGTVESSPPGSGGGGSKARLVVGIAIVAVVAIVLAVVVLAGGGDDGGSGSAISAKISKKLQSEEHFSAKDGDCVGDSMVKQIGASRLKEVDFEADQPPKDLQADFTKAFGDAVTSCKVDLSGATGTTGSTDSESDAGSSSTTAAIIPGGDVDSFKALLSSEYQTGFGLSKAQADCLAGKMAAAIQQGSVNESEAANSTDFTKFLETCHIALEDLNPTTG